MSLSGISSFGSSPGMGCSGGSMDASSFDPGQVTAEEIQGNPSLQSEGLSYFQSNPNAAQDYPDIAQACGYQASGTDASGGMTGNNDSFMPSTQ